MRIIKLDATNSTNSYLRELISKGKVDDFTVVSTKKQTKGRGQMGTVWESSTSKNLTFSVFKDVSFLEMEQCFYISMVTALAALKTLKELAIPKLSVKWPNDILSENKKVCGVLIENVIKQSQLQGSIIGIGLNVNQTDFENLPKASSLKSISGKFFVLDEVLVALILNLKYYFGILEAGNLKVLKDEYETNLFRKDKPSTFKDAEGLMFSGFITGISSDGKLEVLLEDEIIKTFDLKEISLLY
ncbi:MULTISPECIES: biotin--[acetyl-CoA-carboxylase] ligase [unclassified Algibacter]|uniref:biotin--[acetyl-CoA-carboxylase] ligase n=1 Tax=unclassified Algibacter TaxID=2615009 RepID=UPI00131DC73F|nr:MULTISPECIES: biotin--[acetyl-CoA-carboxylase] ligase [unclassified Algibacter]MCL5130412.1 biotin--[acetyl-CoA-carboxylase] ligase [Algibacter sp. L4_22]